MIGRGAGAAGKIARRASSCTSIRRPRHTAAPTTRHALVRLKAKKAAVVWVGVFEGLAAVGWLHHTAIAADHIMAHPEPRWSLDRVLFQVSAFTELMKPAASGREVKSSPLKAAPNGLSRPCPKRVRRSTRLVTDSYAWFRGLNERRAWTTELLEKSADGTSLHRRQASISSCIDHSATRKTAIAWLVAQKNSRAVCRCAIPFKLSQRSAPDPFLRTAPSSHHALALAWSRSPVKVEPGGVAQAVIVFGLDGIGLWFSSCGVQLNAIDTVPVPSPALRCCLEYPIRPFVRVFRGAQFDLVVLDSATAFSRKIASSLPSGSQSRWIKPNVVNASCRAQPHLSTSGVETLLNAISMRSSRLWRAATVSNCAVSARFSVKHRPAVPAAIRGTGAHVRGSEKRSVFSRPGKESSNV